jgi:vacuolar iron transporter family protein
MNKLKQQVQIEVDAAYLYHSLAARTENPDMADIFKKMAAIEENHADKFLERTLIQYPKFQKPKPSLRARILVYLTKLFGNNIIMSNLVSTEAAISEQLQEQKLKKGEQTTGRENLHFNILQAINKRTNLKGKEKLFSRFEGKHKTIGGNELRAAVLGANDGLVSNLSLVMGVSGATYSQDQILIAGIAGLVAGAISMALGEWLSVQSSRELHQKQIDIETEELASSPEEEKLELSLLYQAKGISKAEAERLATEVFKDKEHALDVLIKEELGIDRDNLGGSAWKAAITSFLLFSFGAFIPLLPFMLYITAQAQMLSLISSSIALFAFGAFITLFTGKSVIYSGGRQVIFGLLAALITFTIGRLIGISIA